MKFKHKLPIPMDVKAQYPLDEKTEKIEEVSKLMGIENLALDAEGEYVVVEELIPEAQSEPHSNIPSLGFTAGFVLMMILDYAL